MTKSAALMGLEFMRWTIAATFFVSLSLTTGIAAAADSDIMPPPMKSPRIPVIEEKLPAGKIAPGSEISGIAISLDGADLRLGDVDVRLFGIVAPQLSAPLGLQARTLLDSLITGKTVTCKLRDRDHDGRILAVCVAGDADLAEQILMEGLALVARGSVQNLDIESRYEAAEQSASRAKRGLWSSIPAALPAASAPAVADAPSLSAPLLAPANKPAGKSVLPAAAAPLPQPAALPQPSTLVAVHSALANEPILKGSVMVGWIERYQILLAALLALLAAGMFRLSVARAKEAGLQQAEFKSELAIRQERRILAAALQGELAAALDICEARIESLKDAVAMEPRSYWPRIRTTLYQAHVGRIGLLGPVLARRVASVYGQMSDYGTQLGATDTVPAVPASRFSGAPSGLASRTSIQKVLQQLTRQMRITLANLNEVEQTGQPFIAPPPLQQLPSPQPSPPAAKTKVIDAAPARSSTQDAVISASAVRETISKISGELTDKMSDDDGTFEDLPKSA